MLVFISVGMIHPGPAEVLEVVHGAPPVRRHVRAVGPAASTGFPEGPPTRKPGGAVCRRLGAACGPALWGPAAPGLALGCPLQGRSFALTQKPCREGRAQRSPRVGSVSGLKLSSGASGFERKANSPRSRCPRHCRRRRANVSHVRSILAALRAIYRPLSPGLSVWGRQRYR